jgi:hypothetical protein
MDHVQFGSIPVELSDDYPLADFHAAAAITATKHEYEVRPMTEHEKAELVESDRSASHISYSVVATIPNRKYSDEEREVLQQLIRETAMELNVKLLMVFQNRYTLTFEVLANNSGRRREPLFVLEGA